MKLVFALYHYPFLASEDFCKMCAALTNILAHCFSKKNQKVLK